MSSCDPNGWFRRIRDLFRGYSDQAREEIPPRYVGSSDIPENAGIEVVPSGNYQYDPTFVPKLKQDHQILVALFTELGDRLRHRDDAARFARDRVQRSFSSRLLLEQFFYSSLEHAQDLELVDDPDIWRQFKHSMRGIARAVNHFLLELGAGRVDDFNRAEYLKRYEEIMEILGQRISDEEERLHVIYERRLGGRAPVQRPNLRVVAPLARRS